MSGILVNAWMVAQQVIVLFILMGVGFFCSKIGLINESGSKQLTNILFNIVTICVIVESFLSIDFSLERLSDMGIMALCCVLSVGLGALIVFPLFKKTEPSKRSVLRFATIFSNCGFMSLPLAHSVLGDEGVFLVSIFMAVFQVFIWTFGISIFNRGEKIQLKKIFFNPGVVGVVIGLPLFLLKVKLPMVVMTPIGYLADLNTPLAMLIMGYCISQTKLIPQKEDIKILVCSAIRLIIVPGVLFVFFYFVLNIRGVLLCACMIPTAAPSAANTAVFANMLNHDVVLSSRAVSICTLFSIITLPIITALAQI